MHASRRRLAERDVLRTEVAALPPAELENMMANGKLEMFQGTEDTEPCPHCGSTQFGHLATHYSFSCAQGKAVLANAFRDYPAYIYDILRSRR